MITHSADAFIEGQLILIDKPLNWTSFQVVNKVRWLIRSNFGIKKIKVGHAGTLDPLATGLLLICCGKMTKSIQHFQGQEKVYSGKFKLGATTPSYDMETEINQTFPTDQLTSSQIEKTRELFLGEIEQKPPLFSALKKEGKRLYEFAREGETVEIPTRRISIETFELDQTYFPEIHFKVSCSKGTYIRSLAYDFGKALDNGAYLTELRREKIGDYDVKNAYSIDDLEKILDQKSEK